MDIVDVVTQCDPPLDGPMEPLSKSGYKMRRARPPDAHGCRSFLKRLARILLAIPRPAKPAPRSIKDAGSGTELTELTVKSPQHLPDRPLLKQPCSLAAAMDKSGDTAIKPIARLSRKGVTVRAECSKSVVRKSGANAILHSAVRQNT